MGAFGFDRRNNFFSSKNVIFLPRRSYRTRPRFWRFLDFGILCFKLSRGFFKKNQWISYKMVHSSFYNPINRAVKRCWKTAGLRKYYKNSGRAAWYVTRLRTIDLISNLKFYFCKFRTNIGSCVVFVVFLGGIIKKNPTKKFRNLGINSLGYFEPEY